MQGCAYKSKGQGEVSARTVFLLIAPLYYLVVLDRHISVTIAAIARACHIIIVALFVSHVSPIYRDSHAEPTS